MPATNANEQLTVEEFLELIQRPEAVGFTMAVAYQTDDERGKGLKVRSAVCIRDELTFTAERAFILGSLTVAILKSLRTSKIKR